MTWPLTRPGPARPGVLADGGGQSVSTRGSIAMFYGIMVAALAISLLFRFLIAVIRSTTPHSQIAMASDPQRSASQRALAQGSPSSSSMGRSAS